MMKIVIHDPFIEIHPIVQDDLNAVLDVYRQCEDFLALGPIPTASLEMVLQDIELSKSYEGRFCGIYTAGGELIGVVDYVPNNFKGDPRAAYLSLLMIAAPFRKKGVGKAVVEAIENEIRKDAQVNTILSGVSVNNPQAIRFWQRNGYRIVSGPILYPDQQKGFDLRKDFDGEFRTDLSP
jgi:ribosomal protein S18 acetylase RimI-like enzyme